MANALNIMEAFADYGCIGMACFGAGHAVDMEGNLLSSLSAATKKQLCT